jgi:hypothetical protein
LLSGSTPASTARIAVVNSGIEPHRAFHSGAATGLIFEVLTALAQPGL